MEKPLWVKNTAYVGAYGEYWTTWAFHTATASGLLLVLIPLIATRELKPWKLSKSHWISTHCNIYMPNHINIFLGTFGIIFSSKHSRACNQSIGSSLNHLSIKIILKIGSYNSNGLILLLCLVESILIQWIKKNDLLPHYLFWIPCSIQKLEHFTKNSGIHKVEVHDQICMSHQLFPNILCWVHPLKKRQSLSPISLCSACRRRLVTDHS